MTSARNKHAFVSAFLFALLLWAIASLPGDELEQIQKALTDPLVALAISDPVMHWLVSGILASLVYWALDRRSDGLAPLKAAFVAAGYGLLIEVYQGLLPWRSFGADDLIWNTIGALCFPALFVSKRCIDSCLSRLRMQGSRS